MNDILLLDDDGGVEDDRGGSLALLGSDKEARVPSSWITESGSVLTFTKLVLSTLATLKLCPSNAMSNSVF